MATTEMQKSIPADVMRYERAAFDAALDLIKNRGTSFIASNQKDALTDKQVALILHVALNNGLDPLTEITWLGRPYVNAQGMLRKAGAQIAKIQTVVPTVDEYEALVAVYAIDDGDTLMAVDVTLTDGSVMREFGSANADDCPAASPTKWQNGVKLPPKLSRRILANMASTRALRRVCERITKLAIPSEESAYEAQEFVTEIEPAALPAAQHVADAPLPRKAKPKAEPAPEPAKPAVDAEVETAKAENRARWAAESETPAAEETVIETTVAEPAAFPGPTEPPNPKRRDAVAMYRQQHRAKFPTSSLVAGACEDFDLWMANPEKNPEGWRALLCLCSWHKEPQVLVSMYGAPDSSEASLCEVLKKFPNSTDNF